MSDILEVEVPQKYFLSKEQTERIVFAESDRSDSFTEQNQNETLRGGRVYSNEGLMRTLGAGHGMSQPMSIEVIGTLDSKRHSQMDVVGSGGLHPTITALKEYPKVGLSLSEIRTRQAKG